MELIHFSAAPIQNIGALRGVKEMSGHIKIRDLELIVALHEEGNLTQAAKRIGISEPAFSKRLRLIERRVQTRLFARGSDGSHATEPGRAFLERARISIQAFYQAVHEAREAKFGERHKLRIGVSADLAPRLIELIRTNELRLYRNLSCEIFAEYSCEICSQLQRHQIDLALITSPPPCASITSLRVDANPFMIVVRPEHPLAGRNSLVLQDVVGFPWILFNRQVHPPLHDLILQRAEVSHQKLNIVHHISQADQVPALLTDAQTLTWLTPPGAERVSRDGLVRIPLLDEQIRLETHLATQASNSSKLVSEFVRSLVKKIEDEKALAQLALPIQWPVATRKAASSIPELGQSRAV
jgi:DNA-binding transcriptional LysR family regulator